MPKCREFTAITRKFAGIHDLESWMDDVSEYSRPSIPVIFLIPIRHNRMMEMVVFEVLFGE